MLPAVHEHLTTHVGAGEAPRSLDPAARTAGDVIDPLGLVQAQLVEGEHVGSVGVLGPTRMNYPQALATVDVVSEQLGHRIEEG